MEGHRFQVGWVFSVFLLCFFFFFPAHCFYLPGVAPEDLQKFVCLIYYCPCHNIPHLDATTLLSRGLAAKGIYPAVDPLDSTSIMLQPRIVGEEHYETAQRVKQTLQRYKELQDIIAIL
ncbi:hypothetical protein Gotur_018249, partial [Gossypium turneri]